MSGESTPRVVSLIASATETVCALGQGARLVGRSHECDHPAEVGRLPALTAPKFEIGGSSAEIDARVRAIVRDGLSVYRVDGEALRALQPDLILTQDHCEVCAVSLADVEAATCTWTGRPVEIVSLRPDSLADAYADIRRVAQALRTPEAGEALLQRMQQRIDAVSARVAGHPTPRVAFIEWVEPLMAGGNWMPELVALAGGVNLFGEAGKHSPWMTWDDLRRRDPDVIFVAPCGFDLDRTRQEMPALTRRPDWPDLRAARAGRVYLADGNQYFNRPGPRLVESLEILAEVLHRQGFSFGHEGADWQQL